MRCDTELPTIGETPLPALETWGTLGLMLPEAIIGLDVGTIIGPMEVTMEDWTMSGRDVGTMVETLLEVGTMIDPTEE